MSRTRIFVRETAAAWKLRKDLLFPVGKKTRHRLYILCPRVTLLLSGLRGRLPIVLLFFVRRKQRSMNHIFDVFEEQLFFLFFFSRWCVALTVSRSVLTRLFVLEINFHVSRRMRGSVQYFLFWNYGIWIGVGKKINWKQLESWKQFNVFSEMIEKVITTTQILAKHETT